MCWGFQCGDGWFDIIYRLCELLYRDCEKLPVVSGVKEKYGGLRFDVLGGEDRAYDIIEKFEFMSEFVCESCGTTKDVYQTEGWIKTTCPKCERKKKYMEIYYHWKWILYSKWKWKIKYTVRKWRRKRK
jgi:hypothetical protein